MLAGSYASGHGLPPHPTTRAVIAVAYLCVFGSLVAFSAYGFLLRTVSQSVATSYAYVNPVVAVLLGVGLAGEQVTLLGMIGTAVIIGGVALVLTGKKGLPSPAPATASARR